MRYYSSTAVVMALTGAVNEIVTTIVVDTVLGLPAQTPFTLVVDVGLSTEEIVTVTDVSGTSLTVTRGEDSSTAVAHTAGAIVRHMMTARDLREPAVHVAAAADVHGIGATASVVGTDTVQTLTNKTINFADNTAIGVPQASVVDLVDDIAALMLADVTLTTSLVRRYATTAARDADIPSPAEGMIATTGTGTALTVWVRRSSAWVAISTAEYIHSRSAVLQTSTGNATYDQTSLTLTPGRWLVSAGLSLQSMGTADAVSVGIYNATAGSVVAFSTGVTAWLGATGTGPVVVYSSEIEIVATANMIVKPIVYPNAGSGTTWRVGNPYMSNGVAGEISAKRIG